MSASNFDPALEVSTSIVPLDWLVFAVIIGITLGAVVLGAYRKRTTLHNADEETRLHHLCTVHCASGRASLRM